jgi:hypothetical protein
MDRRRPTALVELNFFVVWISEPERVGCLPSPDSVIQVVFMVVRPGVYARSVRALFRIGAPTVVGVSTMPGRAYGTDVRAVNDKDVTRWAMAAVTRQGLVCCLLLNRLRGTTAGMDATDTWIAALR